MFKTLKILEQLVGKTTITASERDALSESFAELPAVDQNASLKAAVDEVLAKFSEEKPADPAAKPEEGAGAGDDKKPEDKAPEAASAEVADIKANEDGTFTVQASEMAAFKKMSADVGKLIREKRAQIVASSIGALCFSETNKIGVVLPKHKNEFVEFALSLSEEQSAKFVALVAKMQTVSAAEIGKSVAGEVDSVESSEKFGEAVEKLKSMGFTEADAKIAAKNALTAKK